MKLTLRFYNNGQHYAEHTFNVRGVIEAVELWQALNHPDFCDKMNAFLFADIEGASVPYKDKRELSLVTFESLTK